MAYINELHKQGFGSTGISIGAFLIITQNRFLASVLVKWNVLILYGIFLALPNMGIKLFLIKH